MNSNVPIRFVQPVVFIKVVKFVRLKKLDFTDCQCARYLFLIEILVVDISSAAWTGCGGFE